MYIYIYILYRHIHIPTYILLYLYLYIYISIYHTVTYIYRHIYFYMYIYISHSIYYTVVTGLAPFADTMQIDSELVVRTLLPASWAPYTHTHAHAHTFIYIQSAHLHHACPQNRFGHTSAYVSIPSSCVSSESLRTRRLPFSISISISPLSAKRAWAAQAVCQIPPT